MASLLLLTGTRQGQCLPLQGDRIVLGRDPSCDVVINSTMVRNTSASRRPDIVSRRHAVISCLAGKYYLEDGDGRGNPSRNHTFVNNEKIAFPGRVLLRSNDLISICDFSCTFHDEETPFSVSATLDRGSSSHSLQAQPAEKLRLILEISNHLSTTLDLDVLFPRIVENLLQLFKQADRGFIILREEPSGALVVRAIQTRHPADANDPRFSSSILRLCLDQVQAIVGNDPAMQFPESESIPILPIRSLMCAPLWSQEGRPLGAIQLDTQRPNTKFTEDDLKLLLGVASQASIALCNARLHQEALINLQRQRALQDAHQVQLALLPQQMPDIPGYRFHAYYESAEELGGDYYDFIPLPGQRLAILLGDVAGKGVPAALVMVKFSVEARVCLQAEPDLPSAITRLNTLITRAAVSDRFITLIAVVLDPVTHTVTLVNAGHPSPLLFRRSAARGEEVIPTTTAGPPVGIDTGYPYTGVAVQLEPGDGLLLFSDGIIEALDAQGRHFKTQGVHTALADGWGSPCQAGERLIQAVKQHAAGCRQNDDITLVCFGRGLPDAGAAP